MKTIAAKNPEPHRKIRFRTRGAACAIAVMLLAPCGPSAVGNPVVNIDFNGGGDPAETTGGGVFYPHLDEWNGVSPSLGLKVNMTAAGPAFSTRMNVNIIEAGGDIMAFTGAPKLYDGLLDLDRIVVDLENLIPGSRYTLAVYTGGITISSLRISVQGVVRFQGISSLTLPGVEDQDYTIFSGIPADGDGKIRVIVEESTPDLSAMLSAIQITGPFVGGHPDAEIGTRPASLVGAGRISRTGAGQTVNAVSRRGRLTRLYAKAGFLHFLSGGRVLISARRSDRNWNAAYFDTTSTRTNITARAISIGHVSDSLHSSSSPMLLTSEVRATRRGKKSRKPFLAWLRVQSDAYLSSLDRVQGRVRIR